MMNVNNKIDTTLIAKKTTLNFNGAELIDLDKNLEVVSNDNHIENEFVEINTCDRHYVDLTMKLQPIIPNGEGTIADDQWRNSKCKCCFHCDFFRLEDTIFHLFFPQM